jgi:superfamily II DNA or RNA helicase
MTATLTRKDGHHPIINMQCGLVRFHLSAKKAAEASHVEHQVIPRFTDFACNRTEQEMTIHDIYTALVTDQRRNELIIRDLQQALGMGRSPLVLTSRTDHLDYLAGRLIELCPHIFVLKGGMGDKMIPGK